MRDQARRIGVGLAGIGLLGVVTFAQVIPTSYQMTRTNGAASNTFTFQKVDMSCRLPRGGFTGPAIRIADPADQTLDCQYNGEGNWTNLQPDVDYTFALRGCVLDTQGATVCGGALTVSTGVPGVPGGPLRLAPTFQGVSVAGVIEDRMPIGGLDVIRARVTDSDLPQLLGAPFWLGAENFNATGMSPQIGDRAFAGFYRRQP